MVRAGCTLVARTEPAGFRGYSIALAAEKNENLIIDDLDDDHEELEEEIEAVHCYCNNGPKTPKVTQSQSLGSAVLGAFGGKNFRKCNDFVGLFDRYAKTLIKCKYCEVILSHYSWISSVTKLGRLDLCTLPFQIVCSMYNVLI